MPILLKTIEEPINPESPWVDDALNRKRVAEVLGNIIAEEPGPMTVCLNGAWGSGKTFLLRRWQAELRNGRREAIYFNAWEDDYCGDPLVAMIGQVRDVIRASDGKEICTSIKENAAVLVRDSAFNALRAISLGVADLSPENLRSVGEKALVDYEQQVSAKNDIRKRLAELADSVRKRTQHPLVFIIDELDRCRPTFSIELLERVKHIFSVPNIVFVLGVDRTQLAASVRAAYGLVDSEGYLRRFFDLDLGLPLPDVEKYCSHLMEVHGLKEYLDSRRRAQSSNIYREELDLFYPHLSRICAHMRFTLRESEHLIRGLCLLARGAGQGGLLYPSLSTAMVILRIKNRALYDDLVSGKRSNPAPGDYLSSLFQRGEGNDVTRYMNLFEVVLYLAERVPYASRDEVLEQLVLLEEHEMLTNPDILSKRTKGLDDDNLAILMKTYRGLCGEDSAFSINSEILAYLHSLLDLSAQAE